MTTKTLSTVDSPLRTGLQYARRFLRRASRALGGGLLATALAAFFLALGFWQLRKADAATALQTALESCARAAPGEMPVTPGDAAQLRHRRYVLRGQFDAGGQILLDNRIHQGRAGYHVLTPLRLDGAAMHVLINRGWVPAAPGRRTAPDVAPPAGRVVVTGVAVEPPRRVFTLGEPMTMLAAARVWQQLDFPRLRSALDRPLQPVVVRLDSGSPHGYVRAWPRADERVATHLSYAWQWFGFALAAPGIWLFLLLRRR